MSFAGNLKRKNISRRRPFDRRRLDKFSRRATPPCAYTFRTLVLSVASLSVAYYFDAVRLACSPLVTSL